MSVRTGFPTYLEMPRRVPDLVWRALQALVLGAVAVEILLLGFSPALGLQLFWGLVIPVLPAVFFLAPGLWRNVCPLASVNQVPRVLDLSRGLSLPRWAERAAFGFAVGSFFFLVATRKVILDTSAPALLALLAGSLTLAFLGGLVFRGKSGWCGTFCPLLPVQRLYGQTPFATARNAHCAPCVGCMKNCYDFSPHTANLADLYDDDRRYSDRRRLFAGAMPGLVLAYFLLPNPPDLTPAAIYLGFLVFVLISAGTFFLLDTFLSLRAALLPAVYGAIALNLYYAFSVPLVLGLLSTWLGFPIPAALAWLLELALAVASIAWLWRTRRAETRFLAQAVLLTPMHVTIHAAPMRVDASSQRAEILFLPNEKKALVEPGTTVLEVAERSGLRLEAGCRSGVCGADPVAVVRGEENLSPAGDDERQTLNRLGYAGNTRMACSARIFGQVQVNLQPERAQATRLVTLAHFKPDLDVRRVVILGNGIAGVTAADQVRLRHPTCDIQLVGEENHVLYNRMAITRLIYGRSAMDGLQLLPERWYDEHRIGLWVNTRARAIDLAGRQVTLATGEALAYDRLILAMGASSAVPGIQGFGMRGTFVVRSAQDAMGIRAFVQDYRCAVAVVTGGGLLGLETAYALQRLGLKTLILGHRLWPLTHQLDPRSGRFLREQLETMGMTFVRQAEAVTLLGDSRLRRVILQDGRSFDCDLLVACVGIRPNVGLALQAGLRTATGVVVDDAMRTSDANILAAGDVAEHHQTIHGLWPDAVDQAVVAAANALGARLTYRPRPRATLLKVPGIELATIGKVYPEPDEAMVITHEEPSEKRYRKLVVVGGRIAGAILLGYPREVSGVVAAVAQEVDVSPQVEALLAGDWSALTSLAEPRAAAFVQPKGQVAVHP